MTRAKLFHEDPKEVRDTLRQCRELADQLHQLEKQLVTALKKIDTRRYYVRVGFNSLRGFCVHGLRFSKNQGQRIVTQVRHPLTPSDEG